MNGQIVHDSIHTRAGWTLEYALIDAGATIGYGSVAVAGPWKNRPTVYEFYVVPERRSRSFELFETFLAASAPEAFEVQTSDTLSTVMCLTYARDIGTESIVFRDDATTMLQGDGAALSASLRPRRLPAPWRTARVVASGSSRSTARPSPAAECCSTTIRRMATSTWT
jgi:hypothetical protein